jgi:protein arginine phosphatase
MAERILKGKLKKTKGKYVVQVASAGLIDRSNNPADPIAARILEDHGFDGLNHQSRLLTEEMVSCADMIIVMEGIHKQMIIDQYPREAKKIYLLKSFSQDHNEEGEDIRDPYKLSIYHYRLCFSEIFFALDGLLKCI